jgi:hypothetical protein
MCVLPASHLKVHATIEKGLADEQGVLWVSFALGGAYFPLGGSDFSSCMHLPMSLISSVAKGPKFRPQNFLNS